MGIVLHCLFARDGTPPAITVPLKGLKSPEVFEGQYDRSAKIELRQYFDNPPRGEDRTKRPIASKPILPFSLDRFYILISTIIDDRELAA